MSNRDTARSWSAERQLRFAIPDHLLKAIAAALLDGQSKAELALRTPRRWRAARVIQFAGALTAIMSCLCISAADAAEGKFRITSKGQAEAEIVVQAEPPEEPVAFAAGELRRYVKEMSGAELPVVHERSRKRAIVLSAHALAKGSGALQDSREEDHYQLTVDSKMLQVEGASPRAVLFGVYDVLERLGCGWCVPGDETVPKRTTLELPPMQTDTRPAFQYRMMLDFPLLTVAQSLAITDWIAKNRLNWIHPCPNAHGEPKAWYDRRERVVPELRKRGLHLIVGGHTMATWVPETNSAAHPEWFALQDGQRKPPTLCISNPEMTAELIRNMRHFLDRCPEVEAVDFWHTDGTVFCHCEKCTREILSPKGATPSPEPSGPLEQANKSQPGDAVQSAYIITYVELLNRVAGALAQTHPKIKLAPLIYSQTDHALPDGAPPITDNILVGLAHFYRDSYRPLVGEPKSAINYRFLGDDLTWIAKSKHSYIYEYYNGWVPPYVYPGAQVIVRDLQTLQALEIQGASSDMYGYSPINMYVAARALWSPGIDWKNTVRDFCNRYYGDVAEEMAANEIRLNSGLFGLSGYQSANAREPETSVASTESGRYLQKQRPEQIELLKALIDKTKDPQVKVRLERALKPWSLWNKEPRFWAFPDFADSK